MLRSMIIGLAIAALLQVGVHVAASATDLAAAAQRIDWVELQSNALVHLISDGYTLLMR